jgi:4-hydroxybenzoate polyprenyltransferase
MKHIQAVLYLLYNILLFCIGGILLIGIIVMASLNSWYYLLLYIPILLFIYESEAVDFRKKRTSRSSTKKF